MHGGYEEQKWGILSPQLANRLLLRGFYNVQ